MEAAALEGEDAPALDDLCDGPVAEAPQESDRVPSGSVAGSQGDLGLETGLRRRVDPGALVGQEVRRPDAPQSQGLVRSGEVPVRGVEIEVFLLPELPGARSQGGQTGTYRCEIGAGELHFYFEHGPAHHSALGRRLDSIAGPMLK
jgi:hypothetical protein